MERQEEKERKEIGEEVSGGDMRQRDAGRDGAGKEIGELEGGRSFWEALWARRAQEAWAYPCPQAGPRMVSREDHWGRPWSRAYSLLEKEM